MFSRDFWRAVRLLYVRELRCALRERSIVVGAILIPIFLYPGMLWVMFTGMTFVMGETEGFVSRVEVRGAAAVREPLQGRIGVEEKLEVSAEAHSEDEARTRIRDGRLDALLELLPPSGAGEGLAGNFLARVTYDGSKERSTVARERLFGLLAAYRDEWLHREARARGLTEQEWQQVSIVRENTASEKQMGAHLLSMMLPVFMIIMVAMGCFFPAVEATAGELKTKPSQHSVRELRAIGIQPDVLLCRTDRLIPPGMKKKIALHCNLDEDAVISALDVQSIYEVPLQLHSEGLEGLITKGLKLADTEPNLGVWQDIVKKLKEPTHEVNISIVGKYVGLKDSYKSLTEALMHGGIANDSRVNLLWVDSEEVERDGAEKHLADTHGILVPGGFGERGIEGKIKAIQYAREKKIPFFGICLGLQCAVIEFARNVCGLERANSTEFDKDTPDPVIYLMAEWYDYRLGCVQKRDENSDMGGTMRLGAYPCVIEKDTLAYKAYEQPEISERHRHRYEFNNAFREVLGRHGMRMSGTSPNGELVEIIELGEHPWFLGCQFHPEFKSRPSKPHPLFREFIAAALGEKRALFPHDETKVEAKKEEVS